MNLMLIRAIKLVKSCTKQKKRGLHTILIIMSSAITVKDIKMLCSFFFFSGKNARSPTVCRVSSVLETQHSFLLSMGQKKQSKYIRTREAAKYLEGSVFWKHGRAREVKLGCVCVCVGGAGWGVVVVVLQTQRMYERCFWGCGMVGHLLFITLKTAKFQNCLRR